MSRHTGQTSSISGTHSKDLQLAVLTQQNQRLLHETLPIEITHYYHQQELNLLLHTAKQLK